MRTSTLLPAVLALLLAAPALAQRVVVLELDGDGGRLRSQVEDAARAAGGLTIIPLARYVEAAAAKRLRGASAMTGTGVARVGEELKIDVAVGGEVKGSAYSVIFFDRNGQQLWTRDLKLERGLLSPDFADRLGRALLKAAEVEAKKHPDQGGGGEMLPEIDLTGGGDTNTNTDDNRVVIDRNRDEDLDNEGRKPKATFAGPPMVKVGLSGTTTWRVQCLRPGVLSCADYSVLNPPPQGIVIDFKASVPYLGGQLDLELFPLAKAASPFLRGFGLVAYALVGSSLTRIVEETPQGAGPERPVTSIDFGFTADLAWRFFFNVGYGKPPPTGYVGVRGGFRGRSFTIDPNAAVSLPSSQRAGFPVVGLDVSVPISSYFRVEGFGTWQFSPRPSAEQVVGYGNLNDPTGGVETTGLSVGGGFAGEISNGFGWRVHLTHTAYKDTFFGQGQKWTTCNDVQCGGVGEESFTTITWGATYQF